MFNRARSAMLALTFLLVGGSAFLAMTHKPVQAQEFHCYPAWWLINGACPDPCPYGEELCPCIRCDIME